MTRRTTLVDGFQSDAVLSDDRAYRYRLMRMWDWDAPLVNFVMLNPSTADATDDDPTIRRCVGFSRSWGYGGVVVTNLFALRSTEPARLALVADPVGPDNDRHVVEIAINADLVVCAWGAFAGTAWARRARLAARVPAVLDLIEGAKKTPHVLRFTKKSGEPGHPLFLPGDLRPVKWRTGR